MNYASFATQYIGIHEGSSKHHFIIDSYNNIKPLPRGYKVKYTDSWCAAFVSFVLLKCSAKHSIYECSCDEMYKKALKYGDVLPRNATLKSGDIVFYNWDSNGTIDHVGIIASVSGNNLRVIEGNKNDAVGVRIINRSSKYIYGFVRVPQNEKNYDNAVKLVIAGCYGNGTTRIKRMKDDGYTETEIKKIQQMVNEKLRK